MRTFKAEQLTFTTLDRIPVGAIARLAAVRNDVSLFLRCADNQAGRPNLIFLGGSKSLEWYDWQPDALAMTLIEPGDVRFELGERDFELSHSHFGVMGITAAGAYVASRSSLRHVPKLFDVSNWTERAAHSLGNEFALYPHWQIGTLDVQGNFVRAEELP